MTLGVYIRVSTDEQAEKGVSIENQEKRGMELAFKLGYDFKVFSDAGLSGTIPFNKRPGLNELLNQVIEKKIQAIFVTDLDRLSRGDIIQTTIIKNIIKDNKARLFEIEKEIDLNVIAYAKSLVKDFKKITDLQEKINFIRNLISAIWIRWDEEELNHWIGIQFRIDKLQDYQFAKQVLVNRTGVKNHKRLTKIISEEVMIAKSVNSEEGFLRTDGMFTARYLS